MPEPKGEKLRQEVKERLEEGEGVSDIADDIADLSPSTVSRIKDDLEEEKSEQLEKEDGMFDEELEVSRNAFEEIFRELGVGVKVDGDMKAKVDRALSAIELEGATEDPWHARDILYEEGDMTEKWANRIVGKVFGRPGFPRDEQSRNDPRGRRRRDRREYRDPPPRDQGRREEYRGRNGAYREQPERGEQEPYWARNLYEQLEEQADALETVAEAIQADRQQGVSGGPSGNMIEVHEPTEDGRGRVYRVPANSPQAQELLGASEDDDMLETLIKAKEAGLIPDPRDFEDDDAPMADALQAGLERMADAQQESSQNLQAAIGEIRQLATTDDSDDLTAEDVQDILDDRLSRAEQDRLRDEITSLREEVRSSQSGSFVSAGESGTPLTDDPEVLTRYVDKQAESEQLNTVKHAGDKLVEKGIPELREGLRELGMMMSYGQPPSGENAPGSGRPTPPGYTPPHERETAERTVESVEPEPEPEEPEGSDDVRDLWNALTEEST